MYEPARRQPSPTRAVRREQRRAIAELLHGAHLAELKVAASGSELVFRTRTGNPIEPRNFVRSFQRICTTHGVRIIRIHDVRHTNATALKNSGAPARDAQLILGHSTVQITQEIYQHGDMGTRRESLERVERLFLRAPSGGRSRQYGRQTLLDVGVTTKFSLAGEGGRIPNFRRPAIC